MNFPFIWCRSKNLECRVYRQLYKDIWFNEYVAYTETKEMGKLKQTFILSIYNLLWEKNIVWDG